MVKYSVFLTQCPVSTVLSHSVYVLGYNEFFLQLISWNFSHFQLSTARAATCLFARRLPMMTVRRLLHQITQWLFASPHSRLRKRMRNEAFLGVVLDLPEKPYFQLHKKLCNSYLFFKDSRGSYGGSLLKYLLWRDVLLRSSQCVCFEGAVQNG